MNDGLLTLGELVERQVYWRSPLLVRLLSKVRRARRGRQVAPTSPKALEEGLQAIVPSGHPLLMVHSAVSGIALSAEQDPSRRLNSLNAAEAVLDMLTRLAGPGGTLVMPTHPAYEGDPGFMHDKSRLVLTYDPAQSPSTVGLITEIFRRRPGTLRSLHPLSSLAASGPLASGLLAENLNADRPLPHGVRSGYHRVCQQGGLVISIGVPLIKCITVFHSAEEVRDGEWPIKNFFYERRFNVVGAKPESVIVRERRPEFVRCLPLEKGRRDLLKAGILHESRVGGIRLDWANAGEVFQYMMDHNRRGYPYYVPWAAGVR